MRPLSQTARESSPWRLRLRRALKWGLPSLAGLVLILACLYAEENRRGKSAWEKYRRSLTSKAVELDFRKLAPPPVPDPENLATTPFFAALFDYLPGTYTPRDLQAYNRVAGFAQTEAPYAEARGARDPFPAMVRCQRTDLAQALGLVRKAQHRKATDARAEPQQTPSGRRELAASLLEALEEYRPILDELRDATSGRQARFGLPYTEEYTWRVSQPHLPVLKRISRVLLWRGSAELALENPAAAAEDVVLTIALAAALKEEPLESSFLARNILLFNARQIIWEGLADRRWSDSQLREFQLQLQPFTLLDAQRFLGFERAAGNNVFELAHKEPEVVKGWRLGPTIGDRFRTQVLHYMPGGWMYLEQVSYHRAFDSLIARALDLEAGRIRPQMVERACAPTFPVMRHALVATPVLRNARFLLLTAALAQTGVNQTILACALERHRQANGRCPESLDALSPQLPGAVPVDVITGKPMMYRGTTGGQFVLYSVGWNEKDDGGKAEFDTNTKDPDATKGDWVWPAYPDAQNETGHS